MNWYKKIILSKNLPGSYKVRIFMKKMRNLGIILKEDKVRTGHRKFFNPRNNMSTSMPTTKGNTLDGSFVAGIISQLGLNLQEFVAA